MANCDHKYNGNGTTLNQGDDFDYFSELPDIPAPLLNDLCSRFLINIPDNEKNDMVRICFQIELAHWYYIDFCRQEDPTLPACGMKAFISKILTDYKFLNKTSDSVQTIYERWKMYKLRVPVYGAILLDAGLDNCLLVRGFHKKTHWSFPKGKVNDGEEGIDCAIREVHEEVGYDISQLIHADNYLENNFHDHQVRLYIIPAVDPDFPFKSRTRDEIKEIRWFPVEYLPTTKKDKTPQKELGLMANNFFMIHSFIKPLQKWIAEKRSRMSASNIASSIFMTQEALARKEQVTKTRRDAEREIFKLKHFSINRSMDACKEDEKMLKSLLGLDTHDAVSPVSLGHEKSPYQPEPLASGPDKKNLFYGGAVTDKKTPCCLPDTLSSAEGRKKSSRKKSSDGVGQVLLNGPSTPHSKGRASPSTPSKKETSNYNSNKRNKNQKAQNTENQFNSEETTLRKRGNSFTRKSGLNLFPASSTLSDRFETSFDNEKFDFCSSAFVGFRLDRQEIVAALHSVVAC